RKRAEEALRTSEARLKTTLRGSQIGVWDVDLRATRVYYSATWKRQLGYDDHEIGTAFEEWETRIHPDDRDRILPINQACQEGRTEQFEHEHRLRHKDGSYRWILARGSLIRNEQGEAIRMLGIHIDTTDRKRNEEELRAAKEAAEAANKAKSEFLANMSHEIRTPMNGVLGTTELLLNSELTDKQRHLASTVHRSGRTLLAIINDILDFSKIEAGKLELESVSFDLSQILSESLELFVEAARRKQLRLTQHIGEGVPLYLKGDPVRFRQILMNLLSNAIKFTETGEVSLTTELAESTTSHVLLRLAVADSGIGISAAATSYIFDAFSQADGSTTRRFGGTGLGLSIAKQLVGLMGGTITVESSTGNGSTFSFTARLARQPFGAPSQKGLFPRARLSAPSPAYHQAVEAPRVPLSSLVDEASAPKPAGRILLAEDSPVNREVAVGMLELLGYEVVVAENGRQALMAADEDNIDMVLMDCQMPEMDGLTATGDIRHRETSSGRRRLPIIAVTAHAIQGDRERCLAAGMDDYLTKPYTQRQLRDVILKWLIRKSPTWNSSLISGTTPPASALEPDSYSLTTEPIVDSMTVPSGIDLKALAGIRALQRPDRPDVLSSVLRKYLDNSRDSVDALRDAIRANDPAALQAIAHRLKSSSAQLGAVAMATRCRELEAMGDRKNLIDADRVLAQLQSDYLAACAVFRNEIAKGRQS
nr:response regulator [Nitrospira sp.]